MFIFLSLHSINLLLKFFSFLIKQAQLMLQLYRKLVLLSNLMFKICFSALHDVLDSFKLSCFQFKFFSNFVSDIFKFSVFILKLCAFLNLHKHFIFEISMLKFNIMIFFRQSLTLILILS